MFQCFDENVEIKNDTVCGYFTIITKIVWYRRQAIVLVKGHEPKSYETPSVIVGLFSNFTTVEMKGHNKSFNHLII